jgi:RimJ/RimL family protein N-acetyltransferase
MLFDNTLITDRLLLESISVNDYELILELVNSEGWLKFIGNRNIHTEAEAIAYIQKIIDSTSLHYWIVRLKSDHTGIGTVTFIKRDYLEHHDIGFAFLPAFFGMGYAQEATLAVLNSLIRMNHLPRILATTVPDNVASIKLLKKLGLSFENEIEVGDLRLSVYGASTDSLQIDASGE